MGALALSKTPVTTAVRFLRQHGVDLTHHLYDYVEKGGTAVSSSSLGVPEHAVVKTLVMEDDKKQPLIVLMHGDRQVSTRELARQLGVTRIGPCTPDAAEKHTGYQVGGTSPFGMRKAIPVYVESTILQLDRIYINGGKRGYLVGIAPSVLDLVKARPVSVGISS